MLLSIFTPPLSYIDMSTKNDAFDEVQLPQGSASVNHGRSPEQLKVLRKDIYRALEIRHGALSVVRSFATFRCHSFTFKSAQQTQQGDV